jgi:hypothetical protein
MQLKLKLNGEEKILHTGFVKAIIFRKWLELKKEINLMDLSAEDTDKILGLISEMYDGKVTVDELWEGIHAHELQEVMANHIDFICGVKVGEDSGKK